MRHRIGIGPGFRTGLARTRNGPHTPEALAGFRVVGVKETPNPYVASGNSDNDFPVEHSRRPGHCVALAILVNVDSPFHRACGGVKRDEMRIERFHVNGVIENCHSAIRTMHSDRQYFFGKVSGPCPDFRAQARVESSYGTKRLGDVHNPADDDGR